MAAGKSRKRSRLDATRELRSRPRGVKPGADPSNLVIGVVVAVDAPANRVKVAIHGGAGSWVIAAPPLSNYIVGRTAAVLVNPLEGGRAQCVLFPVLDPGSTPGETDLPDSTGEDPSSTKTRTVVIRPKWSGTYRVDRSAFDRWNETKYGGRSTMYQGDAHGSGDLIGLCVYGNQIRDLGATTIDSMVLTVRGAGLNEVSYPTIEIKASTNGSKPGGAPNGSGSSFNASPGKDGVVKITVPSGLYSSFADGTYKGFSLWGSSYGAVRGTSAADGMALKITYTAPN